MTAPEHLSPEARAFLADPPPVDPSVDLTDPVAVQAWRDEIHDAWLNDMAILHGDDEVEEVFISGVGCLRITPATVADDTLALIHIHGGAFVLGTPEVTLSASLPVARNAGIPVMSVDYRLAPEYPFPAAVEDCLAVYRSQLADGIGPDSIGVFGESAGGGLTLSLAVAARDHGLPLPGALAAIAPAVDCTSSSDTFTTLAAWDPFFDNPATDVLPLVRTYIGDTDPRHPWLSPVFADLGGLPPLLIQVGGREILAGDSFRLARAARSAGVDVTLDVWDGMFHTWHMYPAIPEAAQALQELSGFLVGHLGNSGRPD